MLRIVLLSALLAVSAAQQYTSDPKNAAILNEDRYLRTNGQFGAAYSQEDGVQFKEESDADGTRRGSYSYVDPTGQRRTISYVAGKNGFQPTGDHIPAAPAPVVNPLPQYNPPAQPQAQYNPRPAPVNQEEDGQWIDDTRQEYPSLSNNQPQQTWTNPQTWSAPAQQQWSAPAQQQWTAPAQQQWTPPAQQQWTPPAQQQWTPPAPTAAPAQRWSAPVDPTPAPHRFFPPGKLSLNRSPDGFSFSFNKA